jgi:hypothetical protein
MLKFTPHYTAIKYLIIGILSSFASIILLIIVGLIFKIDIFFLSPTLIIFSLLFSLFTLQLFTTIKILRFRETFLLLIVDFLIMYLPHIFHDGSYKFPQPPQGWVCIVWFLMLVFPTLSYLLAYNFLNKRNSIES